MPKMITSAAATELMIPESPKNIRSFRSINAAQDIAQILAVEIVRLVSRILSDTSPNKRVNMGMNATRAGKARNNRHDLSANILSAD